MGKLAVIVDVIDHSRVLVDGPTTDVKRQSISFKRCTLTQLKIKIPRSARSKIIEKYITEQNLIENWNKTAWAKKLLVRKVRSELSDFDRFKMMIIKKQVYFYNLKKRAVIGKQRKILISKKI